MNYKDVALHISYKNFLYLKITTSKSINIVVSKEWNHPWKFSEKELHILEKTQLLLIIRIMIWHWKYGTNINVLNTVNVIRTHISYLKFWRWWHFNVLTFIFNYFNDFKKQIFLILSPQYNKSKDIL